jgi:hypothetical protein
MTLSVFRGITFRSRLEARWAAFFTQIGWTWVYEPFAGRSYIPDFLIQGSAPLLVEVKPYATAAEFMPECARVAHALEGWAHHIAVFGLSPFLELGQSILYEDSPGLYAAGPSAWGEQDSEECALAWATCAEPCGRTIVWHRRDAYTGIPCGHHDGDHHLRGVQRTGVDVRTGWLLAGEETRWVPASPNGGGS